MSKIISAMEKAKRPDYDDDLLSYEEETIIESSENVGLLKLDSKKIYGSIILVFVVLAACFLFINIRIMNDLSKVRELSLSLASSTKNQSDDLYYLKHKTVGIIDKRLSKLSNLNEQMEIFDRERELQLNQIKHLVEVQQVLEEKLQDMKVSQGLIVNKYVALNNKLIQIENLDPKNQTGIQE